MVLVRKIKELQGAPCFVVKMEIDFERKRMAFLNISNHIVLVSVQHIENIINEWRYIFEQQKDFSGIAPLSHILYEFSSFELNVAAAMKFSNSPAPPNLISTVATTLNKNKHAIDPSRIIHSFTTISQKSKKQIQVNMLYSFDSNSNNNVAATYNKNHPIHTQVTQKNEQSSSPNKQQQSLSLYALAVQEAQGNIKILAPTTTINEWINIANIVYESCAYQTLDFTWSNKSRFLFVVYSDNQFVQYDAHSKFNVMKKYTVESALSCKIVSNYQNECIILKSESDSCHLIDIETQRPYTFEIFMYKQQQQSSTTPSKTTATKKQNNQQQSAVKRAHKNTVLSATKFNEKTPMQSSTKVQATTNEMSSEKQIETTPPQSTTTKQVDDPNNEEFTTPFKSSNKKQEERDESEISSSSSSPSNEANDDNLDLNASDKDLIDELVNENLGKYVQDQEISVSRNAEYVCIGSTSDKSVILYSPFGISSSSNSNNVTSEQNSSMQSNGFEWKKGFGKHYLPSEKIECSCFSDFVYLPFAANPAHLTSIKEIPQLIGELHSTMKQVNNTVQSEEEQKHQMSMQSILAIGVSNSVKVFAIHRIRGEERNGVTRWVPQSNVVLVINEFKNLVEQILWVSAYSLLVILSDYSLYFVKFSPEDIGYALKLKQNQQSMKKSVF